MRLNKHIHSWISNSIVALFLLFLLVTCEKEADKPTGDNKVVLTSTTAGNPGYFSVNVYCSFAKASGQTITDHGFCYATTPNPDINASVRKLGKHTGSSDFSAEISNLEDNKKYYIRAYASFAGGTIYSAHKEITTLKSGKPRISTAVLSGITPFSAVCGGVIESDSGYAITASGICWDADDQFDEIQCLGKAINVSGNLAFSLSFTGLNEGTTYYIKAFASNQKGTSYGEIRSFLSDTVTIPTVSTDMVTNLTSNSVICGGNVINNGFTTVFARGVCWDTTGNPTLQNCLGFTSDGQGIGLFTSYINNLSPSTAYYVKAYATNSKGTSYGNQRNFTTTPSWSCGEVISINHTAGSIAPVAKSVNYGTVQTNLSGSSKCWITQNLGADHQATSATDATEASAGWYWQFNRKQGFKHDGSTRTPNTTWISNISENSDWLPANDPCTLLLGSGWRLPTSSEWTNADVTGGWDNYNETFASVLKLHAAGVLGSSDGSLLNRGSGGFYWSSSQGDSGGGRTLGFGSGYGEVDDRYGKANGFSARCLRD
ncbi:MAG: hypothetical protein AB2L17_01330 [Lentimicrobium sp.]